MNVPVHFDDLNVKMPTLSRSDIASVRALEAR